MKLGETYICPRGHKVKYTKQNRYHTGLNSIAVILCSQCKCAYHKTKYVKKHSNLVDITDLELFREMYYS